MSYKRHLIILIFTLLLPVIIFAQGIDGFLESGLFIFPVNNPQNSLSFYHTRLLIGHSGTLAKRIGWNYAIRLGGLFQQGILNSSGDHVIPEYYVNSRLSPVRSMHVSFYASNSISSANRFYTDNTLLTTRDWGISLLSGIGKRTRINLAYGFQDYIRGNTSSETNYIRIGAQSQGKKYSLSYDMDKYLGEDTDLTTRHFLRYQFHPSPNLSLINTFFTYPYSSRQVFIFHDKFRWTPDTNREIQQEFYSGIYRSSLNEYYQTRGEYFQRRRIRGRWFRGLYLAGDLLRAGDNMIARWWSAYFRMDWIATHKNEGSGSVLTGYKDDSRYGRGLSFKSRSQFFRSKPIGWLSLLFHNLFEGELLYTGNAYKDLTNRSDMNFTYQKNHFRISQKNSLILHSGQELFIYPDTIRTGWIEELSYLVTTNRFRYSGGIIYQSDYYEKLSGTRIFQRFRWSAGRRSSLNLYLNSTYFKNIQRRSFWIMLFWKYHVSPFNLVVEGNYKDSLQQFRWNRLNLSVRFIREFR